MPETFSARFRTIAAVAAALLLHGFAAAEDVTFFEKKIRPVLVKHCYSCHSAEAKEVESGLRLDTRAGIRKGGEAGPAVVPGKPSESLLLEALRYESYEMPPDGRLPDEVIADFETWIKEGAADPRDDAAAVQPDAPSSAAAELWSLKPIGDPEPLAVQHREWPRTPIDRFILARLEAEGLKPVAAAEPGRLLRRVYFDLLGLPPSPGELRDFLADPSPEAFEKVVDRLLARPQFGERWGRHWLDVARYAESNGKSRDVLMPHAWRYRDYVIDAWNADRPYDRFLVEQIAGDLLPADSPEERERQRVATGFLAVGCKTLVGGTQQMDLIDEQIDATTRAMLGLTAACARCHDHKFDPIPTRDYYALAGIFLSTDTRFGGGLQAPKDDAGKTNQLLVLGADADESARRIREHRKQMDELAERQQTLDKRRKPLRQKLPDDWQVRLEKLQSTGDAADAETDAELSKDDHLVLQYAELVEELESVEAGIDELKKQKLPELEFAVGVRELGKIRDCRIHVRGEANDLGPAAPRGFLSCVDVADPPPIPEGASGRLELAQWIAHPENPLTPRVAVNRVWLHLFGRGLVPTVDNFGANGERPTHPELLDYLARRFIENGWSTKSLIREIVLSRTYQLATDFDAAAYAADPDNRLYWRMSRRRLEAEAIRDALLAASGRLDLKRPVASAVARIGDGEVGRGIDTKPLSEPFPHRSVYLPIMRGIVPEVLKIFDFPEPSNVQGQRDATTVPAQSLYLMNSPFVSEQAQGLAERVMQAESDRDARIRLAFEICYARAPQPDEIGRIVEFLKGSGGEDAAAWTTVCHALLAAAEFRYLD